MFSREMQKPTLLPRVQRLAGQSIRDEKERLADHWLVPFYFSTAFLWILWALEESRARSHQPPTPKPFLYGAIIATGIAVVGFGRLWRKFRALNRGECGELRVAEVLDDLRPAGYRAYHDLVEDGFNVDHVVVGPSGVYAIETTFRSGSGVIEYRNGEGLFLGNDRLLIECDRDPLVQARESARAIRERLLDDVGWNKHVRAVLVFAGDWKIKNAWGDTDVAVLSTRDLESYFERYQPELTGDEVKLIASHLERSAKGR